MSSPSAPDATPEAAPSPAVVPYGAWPSPLSATDVARAGSAPAWPVLVGDDVWFSEVRPAESGRTSVVRAPADGSGDPEDLLPAPWSASTRVHEYGGRSFLPVPTAAGTALVFAERADQRLYRLDPGAEAPVPLTPVPDTDAGLRYADPVLSPDGTELWCVREAHTDAGVRRHLVAVPLVESVGGGQQVRELVGGSDFLAFPTPSPDGRHLAWVAWDHPRMPWDSTVLRVADIAEDGTPGPARDLLGGPGESVLQPEWADGAHLYALTDATGWWNPVRVALDGGDPEPLCARPEEFGGPLWQLGMRWYARLSDGRLACLVGTDTTRLAVLDPASGELTDVDTGLTAWGSSIATDGSRVTAVAGSPTVGRAAVVVDPAGPDGGTNGGTGVGAIARTEGTAPTPDLDPAYLPEPYAVTTPSAGGREVHANVYPPRSPDAVAPDGALPPYVVFVHGGPTAQSPMVRSLAVAYWTSRGIGVVDVNYGGSTGYGRVYRDLLLEQWGVVDVEDVAAAATGLAAAGVADGARLAIRGGSAGGWTVLSALTRTDVFAAGTSYYGVAELERFAADTHDFESLYLDGLIGSLPEHRSRYVERAPLTNVAGLSCPVLLLQGDQDRVVPPSQAEMFRDALLERGIPHAYLLFAGEEHGFRREDSLVTALEAELSFYGQVLGFTPPGVPVLELTRP